MRVVIALLAGEDQDIAIRFGEGKGKIAEESTGRGLIRVKIAIYENEPRQRIGPTGASSMFNRAQVRRGLR